MNLSMAKKSKKDDKENHIVKQIYQKQLENNVGFKQWVRILKMNATFLGVKISSMFLISTLAMMFQKVKVVL